MLYLIPDLRHLISDTGIRHAILITWYLTPVLAMLYLSLDIWYQNLPCYTWHLTYCHLVPIHLTWYCDTWLDTITPDTCISLHIHDYHFYGDLIIILSPDIWYSWTPVLLNSCIPEPLKKGDFWYYIPVDPRNKITMNMKLLRTPYGHYYWTILIIRQLIPGWGKLMSTDIVSMFMMVL